MISSASATPARATRPLAALDRLTKNGTSSTATIAPIRIISPMNGCSAAPGSFHPGMNGRPSTASKRSIEAQISRLEVEHRLDRRVGEGKEEDGRQDAQQ